MDEGSAINHQPRVRLIDGTTPIQPLRRIEAALGDSLRGARLFVKRDDLMALGGGGNKLRKLEFLLGEALRQGADTIIATGGLQSNLVRLAAAAAASLGLACEVFLSRLAPLDGLEYDHNGNVLLTRLFGARLHVVPDGADARALVVARLSELGARGARPYLLPAGGTSPLSALGYAAAAQEILEQEAALGLRFSRIVVPNGSSGTHAGLAAGLALRGRPTALVKGYTVLAPAAEARRTTADTARAALALLGSQAHIRDADIDVCGEQRGAGYGRSTGEMLAALHLMAAHEGILLDPVYSAKAFAGLLADAAAGAYGPGDNILFLATGGTPALHAYRAVLSPQGLQQGPPLRQRLQARTASAMNRGYSHE